MVSSVIDLLLSTLFNIEAATVVTLLVEVTLLFLQCINVCMIQNLRGSVALKISSSGNNYYNRVSSGPSATLPRK